MRLCANTEAICETESTPTSYKAHRAMLVVCLEVTIAVTDSEGAKAFADAFESQFILIPPEPWSFLNRR